MEKGEMGQQKCGVGLWRGQNRMGHKEVYGGWERAAKVVEMCNGESNWEDVIGRKGGLGVGGRGEERKGGGFSWYRRWISEVQGRKGEGPEKTGGKT